MTQLFPLEVQGRSLEVQRIAGANPASPTIVFLHEGLGSVSAWRDFPQSVASRTGCSATVYSRYGYGNSEVFCGERSVRYLHDEALLALPELLEKLDIANPILLGHSDGASIAILYAGAFAASARRPRALILLAPHVFVEDLTIEGIAAAKAAFHSTNLVEKLGRHHRDAAATFWSWNRIWLKPEFRSWNIEEYLGGISCPVMAIQGGDDPYGTIAQLEALERAIPNRPQRLLLQNCRHSPHRDQPDRTLDAIADFIRGLPSPNGAP